MSIPVPMDCLAERCPHSLRCNAVGLCVIRDRQGGREFTEALTACREQGRVPEAWLSEGKVSNG